MPRMLVITTSGRSDGWSMTPSTPVPSACTHLSRGASRRTSSFIIGPKVRRTSVDDIDAQLRKSLTEPRGVIVAHVLGKRQQDEQAAHARFSLTCSDLLTCF